MYLVVACQSLIALRHIDPAGLGLAPEQLPVGVDQRTDELVAVADDGYLLDDGV